MHIPRDCWKSAISFLFSIFLCSKKLLPKLLIQRFKYALSYSHLNQGRLSILNRLNIKNVFHIFCVDLILIFMILFNYIIFTLLKNLYHFPKTRDILIKLNKALHKLRSFQFFFYSWNSPGYYSLFLYAEYEFNFLLKNFFIFHLLQLLNVWRNIEHFFQYISCSWVYLSMF